MIWLKEEDADILWNCGVYGWFGLQWRIADSGWIKTKIDGHYGVFQSCLMSIRKHRKWPIDLWNHPKILKITESV